jgi:hypothetical protein
VITAGVGNDLCVPPGDLDYVGAIIGTKHGSGGADAEGTSPDGTDNELNAAVLYNMNGVPSGFKTGEVKLFEPGSKTVVSDVLTGTSEHCSVDDVIDHLCSSISRFKLLFTLYSDPEVGLAPDLTVLNTYNESVEPAGGFLVGADFGLNTATSNVVVFSDISDVPLPPALALFGSGLVGMAFLSRRRKSQTARVG